MAEILITEFMAQAAVERLQASHSVEYAPDIWADDAALRMAVPSVEGLIVRNKTRVTEELIGAADRLRVVGRLGVGLDNIDLDACRRRDVDVFPATGANAVAVAEYVIGAMLVLRRGAFGSTQDLLEGRWPRSELTGRELHGSVLGLVGFGGIARLVATRANALGMSILAHDPHLPPDTEWYPAHPAGLADVLATSDAVSIHVPLLPETNGLIDHAAILTMKPGAILVNTSRGGIVDELAVAEALIDGRLGGAALDVFTTEPPDASVRSALAAAPHLILTPHIGGVTVESNERVSDMIADAVLESLHGR